MPAYSIRASTLVLISNELIRARRIYPDTRNNLETLNAFVGDLNNAMNARNMHPDNDAVISVACIKSATMAIRILEDGDARWNFDGLRQP